MKPYLNALLGIFKFHKKKILFLFASISLCTIMLFPFDDLSDYITLQVTRMTQSNVYLQFDGLSFGFLPQFGIKMENVLVESVYAPTLAVKTVGFAPKLTSLVTGALGGKVKAYDLFDGDATIEIGRSNELDIDGNELALELNLDQIELKELTKYIKDAYPLPVTLKGTTNFTSLLYVDPSFKAQPKGNIQLKIDQLEIPSSNIPLNMNGTILPLTLPALKLSEVVLVGNIKDRKLFIKEGKLGKEGNDLNGTITGDLFFDILPGGRFKMGGYDLNVNIKVGENLKRQLGGILMFVDSFEKIGERHKYDTLNGIRYSMRLTAPSMQAIPRVTNAN